MLEVWHVSWWGWLTAEMSGLQNHHRGQPNPPKSAGGEPPMSEHISTAYVVIKAVAEQQGGRKALSKPYLCSQRHGAHGAEDG